MRCSERCMRGNIKVLSSERERERESGIDYDGMCYCTNISTVQNKFKKMSK